MAGQTLVRPSTLEVRPSTPNMTIRWFFSRTVRQASALRRNVKKILNHQRDILPAKDIEELQGAMQQVRAAVAAGASSEELRKQMENLESIGNKRLRPYPSPSVRENVEVLLVALAVAMGVRTFFLQPFKIPTGSMQPTLYGVISENLMDRPDFKIPTGWQRIREWFEGISYIHRVAKSDGEFQGVTTPVRFLIFNLKQTLYVGGRAYTMWFPPDLGSETLDSPRRANLRKRQFFRKGDDIIRLKVQAGDHLFVDRLTYNFRPPQRGEIIVFATKGIEYLPQDQFYIKRLVALSGERVQIGDDRHLIINGQRLDATAPHFENVYSFDPAQLPRDSQYAGHVNQQTAQPHQPPGQNPLALLFPNEKAVYHVATDRYMVMGDNTMNSLDSRYWGDFPASNVIGRGFFVYWPFTHRFGWACLAQ